MSIYNTICCSRCGRELYRPLNVPECRERRVLHFLGLYVVNDNGQEELCEKCFEVWQKTEMYQEKMREELNKRKKELENLLNMSVQKCIEDEMNMCCCTTTEDGTLLKDLENALFVYDDTDCIKVKYIRQLLDKYKNRK